MNVKMLLPTVLLPAMVVLAACSWTHSTTADAQDRPDKKTPPDSSPITISEGSVHFHY